MGTSITMKWTTKWLATALPDASRLGHASSLTTSARHRRVIGRGAQGPLRFTEVTQMKWTTNLPVITNCLANIMTPKDGQVTMKWTTKKLGAAGGTLVGLCQGMG